MGRAPHRAREAVGDSLLQVGIGFEPDGVEIIFVFEKLIEIGQGEGSIAPEIPARCGGAIARDHGLHHRAPRVGTMHVTGTEHAPFKVTELVEHEERMIACTFEMAVVGSTFLVAMGGTDAAIHVQDHGFGKAGGTRYIDPLSR